MSDYEVECRPVNAASWTGFPTISTNAKFTIEVRVRAVSSTGNGTWNDVNPVMPRIPVVTHAGSFITKGATHIKAGWKLTGVRPERFKVGHYKSGIDGVETMEFGSGVMDAEAPLDAVYAGIGHIQGLGRLGRRPALGGLEQDACPVNNPGGTLPCPDHMLQLVALLPRQPDSEFLPDHTAPHNNVFPDSEYHRHPSL